MGFMANSDKIIMRGVDFFYGSEQVLQKVEARFPENALSAVTGPSGQGKSTLLSIVNCLWNEIPGARCQGDVGLRLDGNWISPLKNDLPLPILRRKVAMIFQEPDPLPMSIARNLAFPLKLAGVRDKQYIREKARLALEQAFLWDEVKDRLESSALELSGGQKQRLCIARALVLEPEILLCDEPTSSLDPKAAGIIEELMMSLKEHCTLLVVSHHVDQVRRLADAVFTLRERSLHPA